jgi:heme/copper-type cytochrome/quinol oxidase subunit 1
LSPLVQRYLRTAIIFLLIGLGLGAWMLIRRELAGEYPGPRLVSAHTHVILVGFVMMMILGVALWMFPRPERDDVRYRPALAEVAYWLLTVSTATRFLSEASSTSAAPGPLHRWVTVLAGLGQVAGLGVFFYNLLPRIRSTRKAE